MFGCMSDASISTIMSPYFTFTSLYGLIALVIRLLASPGKVSGLSLITVAINIDLHKHLRSLSPQPSLPYEQHLTQQHAFRRA